MFAQFRQTRRVLFLPLVAVSLSVASCQATPPSTPISSATDNSASPAANTGSSPSGGGAAVSLTGAGATFPAPLYQTWFAEYKKQNPNTQVSYQAVGSGAGVEQFTKGTVDFGASDVAMKDDEIAKVK